MDSQRKFLFEIGFLPFSSGCHVLEKREKVERRGNRIEEITTNTDRGAAVCKAVNRT